MKFKARMIPTGSPEERAAMMRASPSQLARTLLDDAKEAQRIALNNLEACNRRQGQLKAELEQGMAFVAAWPARQTLLEAQLREQVEKARYYEDSSVAAKNKVERCSVEKNLENEEERLQRRIKKLHKELQRVRGRKPGETMAIPVKARVYEPPPGI